MDQQAFMFQALVYLGAAVILVPLAKRAGLGSVLGYLLAGVLIGPALLNLVGHKGEDILHVAEFGVVMMLFVIGLELEPERLWKLRKSILGLGGLQVLFTFAAFTFLAWLVVKDIRMSLAIGMIIAPSSTAIVLQTLQEKGLMKIPAGQNSFAVLLFQDIAVIPMLAILPLLASGNGGAADDHAHPSGMLSLPGWAQTLVVLGAVAGIILAGRYLVRPLLRLVAATRLREIFTATALLLVIGITVIMTAVGLSPALGSFLGGVVLANSEYRHELESDIEPFKGLLLGLFFIAVGAGIDFGLIRDNPLTIIGIVLLIMILKAIILWTVGRYFSMGKDQLSIFSLGLCQIGEFAFVLLSFTRQENILTGEINNYLVAAVAISMALTPLLFLVLDKVILPRFGESDEKEIKADAINEKNPIIIAGFGHYGNTVGRFLRANGVGATILDNDADRVDFLRQMGFKVFYGDASRYDLLEAAGAAEAKILLMTIDDAEKRLEMIETIKKHFPNLQMMVRSSNRNDAYDLMNAGMLHIYRETLESSLRMGIDTMRLLGFRAYAAQRAALTFRKYDERTLKQLSAIRDERQYINTARQFIEELEQIIRNDNRLPDLGAERGWEEEGLIREASRE
ncbi:monovalent cation:proton antiporter-2 (CPA2) family protein [Flavihumibacter petaseus]|uniref:Glutathione-regulated K(+)/H(+) antiporter KefC n=1 Tax=Flavihumibacter petaseus NBRC 106054 TaxID=1220578 RepID=A0A0E9N3M6_9BACT|nr:monovalent cation:proton antiporter-2 (CPA2) family protein [Flavihumibacter petaseus]GAO43960.1 glutathione-regulated K(+)/H(+) antiporter KefC [Flavihumibacter petaseus NBRC 106054]